MSDRNEVYFPADQALAMAEFIEGLTRLGAEWKCRCAEGNNGWLIKIIKVSEFERR